jgi:hypothetical protein
MENAVNEKLLSMKLSQLETMQQRLKDLETEIMRDILEPDIYSIYADCAWNSNNDENMGNDLRLRMLDDLLVQVSRILEAIAASAGIENLQQQSVGKGTITSSMDNRQVEGMLVLHVDTLKVLNSLLSGEVLEGRLHEFRFRLERATHSLECAVMVLNA